MKKYYQKYNDYFTKNDSSIEFDKRQIIDLFKDSEINDFNIPTIEPIGFGQGAQYTFSGFENMFMRDSRIFNGINSKFIESIGIYRHRMIQTFNPIFWFDFIFKLPEHILKYLGVLPDKLIVKIITLIYWILCLLFGLQKFQIIDIIEIMNK